MQVETMKARTRVHGYMIYINIYIYIYSSVQNCTKRYLNEQMKQNKHTNKLKKKETNNNDARRSPSHTHGGCCRLVKGTSQRYVSFHFYI